MKRSANLIFALLRVALGVGLLAYLAVSGAIDWTALTQLATAWRAALGAVLILLADVALTSWRLALLMKPLGLSLPFAAALRLGMIGTFFNFCLPGGTGGDAVRIYYAMAGNRGRRTEIATIILLDRAVGMFALLLCPLLIAPGFLELVASSPAIGWLLIGAAGVAAGMALVVLLGCSPLVRDLRLAQWTFKKLPLGHHLERMLSTVYAYRRYPAAVAAAVGISLLAHGTVIAAALIVAQATNPAGAAWEMSLLIPLGFLANALPVTPGGLGVGEAAFSRLFALAGLDGGAETMLGWRLLMLVPSGIGLLLYLQGHRQLVHKVTAHEAGTGSRQPAIPSPCRETVCS